MIIIMIMIQDKLKFRSTGRDHLDNDDHVHDETYDDNYNENYNESYNNSG